MYWMTADEITEKNPETAIIPVGSLEQHGPHLPVMTDWAIAMELGRRVGAQLDAFVLPALPISTCREHMGKKGSVWMEPLTFYHVMEDIIMSLKTQGFRKVGIVQAHGGIFVMTPLVRDLNAKHNPDLMVAVVDSSAATPTLLQEAILQTSGEIHAGESETARMLAIAPDTVHMERAVDYIPSAPRSYLNYGSIFRLSPDGVWGYPTRADAKQGEQILERMAALYADALRAAFSHMDAKEKFGYSDF